MRRILITGANRGIGLDLTQRYLDQGESVFATCRHPAEAQELKALAQANADRLKIIPLDVSDQASIAEARRRVGTEADGLEMLINNAGIYPGGVDDSTRATAAFGWLEAAAMLDVFHINTVAPVMIVQAFADLLRKGKDARVINMSSDAGSITQQEEGCGYSYAASKAALNMLTRCLSGEFQADGVIVVSVHPGWIRTDMGGTSAPLALEEAMPGLMWVIDGLTIGETGTFVDWKGQRVEW